MTPTRDQERLALLVRAGDMFHQSLDVTATLNNVAKLAVESFSDFCLFDLLDDRSDRLFVTAAAHRDPSKEEAVAAASSLFYVEEFGVHPVVQVTRTGEPFFEPHMDDETILRRAASRQHERFMRELGYRSKIVVPVTAQNQIFGALTFVRTRENAVEFDLNDLTFAVELGRRAGLAVANAKQFHRQHHVAETLQRAFLPNRFPCRNGIAVSAHYRPGSTEADIGGDWYDAFETESGEIVVTIGDVTGKGVEAARLMVLLRQAIRVASIEHRHPRKIADLCNRMLLSDYGERFASAFIGILNPAARTLRYVSAGHAPPILRLPDRTLRRLQSPSAPLGAFRNADFQEHQDRFPQDSMLVLYTDGVIEVSRDVVAGERMLDGVLQSRALLHTANPAEFIERAIAGSDPHDDIAIMVVTFGTSEMQWQFEAADARAAYTMREEYLRKVAELCETKDAEIATCGLIFSEIIGNAVRHAPGPLSVSLERSGDALILHVVDKGPGFTYEPALPATIWAESGRGLFLISILARRVEVEPVPGLGSHVAVTLPVTCGEGHRQPTSEARRARSAAPVR